MPKNSRDAEAYIQSFNARQRARMPGMLKHVPKLYVFSIYWRPFTVNLGHMGAYTIPGLDREDPEQVRRGYGKPLAVPETIVEEYDLMDGKLGVEFWSALEDDSDPTNQPGVIKDILGLGSSQPGLSTYTTNRTWFGVFVARGSRANPQELKLYKEHGEVWDFPTKYELEQAREKLKQLAMVFYRDAEVYALKGPIWSQFIDTTHREMCDFLGLNPDWNRRTQAKDECPECHAPIAAGLPVHFIAQGGCGAVIDLEKVKRLKTPGYEHLWAAPAGASK